MIAPADFLSLAESWSEAPTEAEWRSAVSRAYYAAFHEARLLFENLGFAVPRSERGHAHVSQRLAHCGEATVRPAGMKLTTLRRERNLADYELQRTMTQASARTSVMAARSTMAVLRAIEQSTKREAIIEAIRRYETDVLRDPTWRE